jgi:hypothetical protein
MGVGTFSSVKSKKKRKERDMFNCFLINIVPWNGILSFFVLYPDPQSLLIIQAQGVPEKWGYL